jgi:indoleamine 2,3-dioxygenase
MFAPLHVMLDTFDISPHTGFLPETPPLKELNPYYKDWEDIVSEAPALLAAKTFHAKAERLPMLSVSKLRSEREWQRAYLLLSFMSHAYIWGGTRPAEVSRPNHETNMLANGPRYYLGLFHSRFWLSRAI